MRSVFIGLKAFAQAIPSRSVEKRMTDSLISKPED
jgi:hypothetical protein